MFRPVPRLRQPRQVPSSGAEPVRRRVAGPRQRHPAAVAAALGAAGPLPGRVLAAPRRAGPRPRAGRAPRPGRRRRRRAARASSSSRGAGPAASRASRSAGSRGRSPSPFDQARSAATRPNRVTCRVTSWLDSTQVGGAPTAACAPRRRRSRRAAARRVPRRAQEVEVERGVQLVGPQVAGQPLRAGHPGLGDEHPRRVVGVGDAPATRGRSRARSSRSQCGWSGAVADGVSRGVGDVVQVGQSGLLDQSRARRRCGSRRRRGRTRTAGCPRTRRGPRGCSQLRSGCSGANRCRYHSPACRRLVTRSRPGRRTRAASRWAAGRRRPRGPAGNVAAALGRPGPGGERRAEPRVLVGGVVGHDVEQHPQAELVGLGDQRLGLVEGAERRARCRGSRRRRSRASAIGEGYQGLIQMASTPSRPDTAAAPACPAMSPMPSPLPSAKLRM